MIAGAIRWDAWHGDRSEVGNAVERSLEPERWHGRLPFFAEVSNRGRVGIDGASQTVLDREIQYARSARLDYWAFLLYASDSAMNHALEHYLTSSRRRGLRFCLILEPRQWTNAESGWQQIDRAATLLANPEYQRVAGSRPLLYLLTGNPDEKNWGATHTGEALSRLRESMRKKNSPDPYVVVLDFRSERAAALMREIHADAISAYAYQRDGKNAPYTQLAQETEAFWEACRATGSAVVPIVMTGWDRRPRVEHPVFWESWQQTNLGLEKFYAAPTMPELTQHLGHAVDWVVAHPTAAESKAILIYAWNENDEGGWLVPTLREGDARVRAVEKALRPSR